MRNKYAAAGDLKTFDEMSPQERRDLYDRLQIVKNILSMYEVKEGDNEPVYERCTSCGIQRRIISNPVSYCVVCGNNLFVPIKKH